MKKFIIAMMTVVLALPFAPLTYAHAGDEYHPKTVHKYHRHHRAAKHHGKKQIYRKAEPQVGHNR
ncbi:hypothetical protein [Sodalis sp. C49]|uniref:hypothetical protein n=1 Tax=unclassified Sodalis (in: enterobacteria) TaxID=2636512 RepID=UPI003965C8D7